MVQRGQDGLILAPDIRFGFIELKLGKIVQRLLEEEDLRHLILEENEHQALGFDNSSIGSPFHNQIPSRNSPKSKTFEVGRYAGHDSSQKS